MASDRPTWRRLTPPGRGAIAAVGVRGDQIGQRASQWFAPRPASDRPIHGRVLDRRGEAIDDAVWIPVSDSEAILTLHGNPLIVVAVTDRLDELGLAEEPASISRWAEPGDTLMTEALRVAASAPTVRGAQFLLEQATRLRLWSEAKDIEPGELRAAIARAPAGLAFERAPRVILAGVPNAGKSTLFNRLLGRARVVVDASPGTTRDRIEEVGVVGERPIVWVDGAGLRSVAEEVEREGVRRMREGIESADLVLLLEPPDGALPDQEDWEGRPVLRILSRADQIPPRSPVDREGIAVSGETGDGVTALLDEIERRLFGQPRWPEEPVPFTERQRRLLAAILEAGENGRDALEFRRELREGGVEE